MADINRKLVPDSWSLVTERALTTGLCVEGWYSEHSGVCRRVELPGRSVKVNELCKVDGSLVRNDLKTKQRQFTVDPLLNRQPVKRKKNRSDVGGSGCFENECGSIVPYLLEFKKKILRTARRKRVAAV